MSRRNGRRSKEERQRQRKQQKETKQEMAEHQAGLQEAFGSDGRMMEGFIRDVVSQEDLTAGGPDDLNQQTVTRIQNLLSQDWVLANLTGAQEHDIRFKLEVMKLKILGTHPPAESYVSGGLRAFLMDDKDAKLEHLTRHEKTLIEELIETLKARYTRGREGFERRQLNTNIARTETSSEDEDTDTGWGLFS